jgi:DNA-binding HxlR family transcriptional regulator
LGLACYTLCSRLVLIEMPPGLPPLEPLRPSDTTRRMAALFELLGRRWTLRILWELRDDMMTFRALRKRCGNPSPTILNRRLQELCDAAIVDRSDGEGYMLSSPAQDLARYLAPVARWADRRYKPGR